MNAAAIAPRAVGNFGDAPAQDRFGVVEHLLRYGGNQLGTELLVERLHARLGDIVRGDLALQIETHHHRLARHVDKGVEQVLPQLAALDEFNSGDANAFMTNFRGPRRVAARRHGADIHHMDEGRAPSDQSTAKMNRRDQIHIRLMDRRQIGIVKQKNIVGMNPRRVFKALDDPFDRKAGAGDMPAHGVPGRQNIAIGEIERRHVIVHLRRVDRAADAFQRRAHFLGDLIEPVRQESRNVIGSTL